MRVLMPCGGTRGDTQPCVALAVALRKAGHEVKFVAPTTHVKLCTDQGFECVEFKFDVEPLVEELLAGSEMRRFGSGLSFVLRSMAILKKPEVAQAARQLLPLLWQVAQDFQPDLILTARPLPVMGICEQLRIPFIVVAYQGVSPTSEFPPMFVNDGLPLKCFRSWHRWLGQTIMPKMLGKMFDMLDLPGFERDVLKATGHVATAPLMAKLYEWAPQLVAAAPEVLPPPRDYGRHQHFTGFWFLDERTDGFAPSAELEAFLADTTGPPVVYLGFGSMKGSASMSTSLTRTGLQALRAAGVRGVLLGGWSGLTRERLGAEDGELKAWAEQNVAELQAVPHTWLFPRVAAVCHHGGAGTLAAGLRAGRPTVVVPFFADQPYWAAQVEARGLGRQGPHVSKLTAGALAPLLRDVATSSAIRDRARQVGEAIQKRDWAGDALSYIDSFMKTYPYPWKVDCQEQGEEAARQRRRAWRHDLSQERCCLPPRGGIPGFPAER